MSDDNAKNAAEAATDEEVRAEIAASVFEDDASFSAGNNDHREDDADLKEQAGGKGEEVVDLEKESGGDTPGAAGSEPKPDPWDGVPPVLKQTIEGLQSSLNGLNLDQFSHRVKQLESRVGSIQNEFHAAKKAQDMAKDAPTKKEMVEAGKTDKAWNALKEDYPEWGEILDVIGEKLPTPADQQTPPVNLDEIREEMRKELQTDFNQQLSDAQVKTEEKLIAFAHKDWRNDINTPEWAEFIASKSADKRAEIMNSQDSTVIIKALDEFKNVTGETPAPKEDNSAADIKASREKRLKKSVVQERGPKKQPPKSKPWEDMTEAERRQAIASEVFNED